MEERKLEKNQLYAVQLNGLHVGLKASLNGSKQEYDPKGGYGGWGGYTRKQLAVKKRQIHKVIQTGKSVSVVFRKKRANRQYYETVWLDETFNLKLNDIVTLEID